MQAAERYDGAMSRIDSILKNDLFLYHLNENRAAEANRSFCRHDMVHFLDVARIAMIMNGEEHLGLPKDWIYAAALLHDIGKHLQYLAGVSHELASARIAREILKNCGYSDEETGVIQEAILNHRDKTAAAETNLNGLLYRADKASRACFACPVEKKCKWKEDRKNKELVY